MHEHDDEYKEHGEYKENDHDNGYVGSSMHDINLRKFKGRKDRSDI